MKIKLFQCDVCGIKTEADEAIGWVHMKTVTKGPKNWEPEHEFDVCSDCAARFPGRLIEASLAKRI